MLYYADVKNCDANKGFNYIYIYIYREREREREMGSSYTWCNFTRVTPGVTFMNH